MLRLPNPCMVVLVGPPASGKSTWAEEWFAAGQIVSARLLPTLEVADVDGAAAEDDAIAEAQPVEAAPAAA